jgi:hypothetical protein
MMLLLLFACPPPEAPVEAEPVLTPLDAPRLLRRMSLDIRGQLPTVAEQDAVEADPAQLEVLRDAMMDEDGLLEERLVQLFGERFLTRLDKFELQFSDFFLEEEQEHAFERSVGEEPLRLMAHIAVNDLPWTDIVTADYTMANDLLASIWPLEYPEGVTGWQVATYTDGRPAAGVLATNGLWWRYVTNISNMNRSRAAAVSRLFMCQDVLSRPVSLTGSVALSDTDGTATALKTNPSCLACHSTVDPLASSLFGFWTVVSYNTLELSYYHAERERLGETYLGAAPAFFGQAIGGMVDLGPAIAGDSRFYSCAAETAAEILWRRPIEDTDFSTTDALRRAFIQEGITWRPLMRAVLDTDEYRAGAFTEAATAEDQDREVVWRMIPPGLLEGIEEQLTGYSWEYEGFDQMANDDPGYRVLAGGVDGFSVTRPQQDPGVTWLLTSQRLAQASASYAVNRELGEGGERLLLQQVSTDDRPGDPAFTAELKDLHWRLYAVRADESWLASAGEFWSTVEADEGAAEAWTRLASAMLRDPQFLGY